MIKNTLHHENRCPPAGHLARSPALQAAPVDRARIPATAANELRVFASRSRGENSVGLNVVGMQRCGLWIFQIGRGVSAGEIPM
jgi:hypothetical protein